MRHVRPITPLLFSFVALLVATCISILLMFQASRVADTERDWIRACAKEGVIRPLQDVVRNSNPDAPLAALAKFSGENIHAVFTVVPGEKPVWRWCGPRFPAAARAVLEPPIADLGVAEKMGNGIRLLWDVESASVGWATYQVVWLKVWPSAYGRCGRVRLVGCVVDYVGGLFRNGAATARLAALLVAGLTLFSLVVVWQLVRTARRVDAEAALKTKFVANYAHELKTPLASLLLRAEMLKDGRYATDEKRSRALGVIVTEGRRLNAMVLNLLDLIRIECRQMKYAHEAFDLAEIVRTTAETMRPFFAANGLEVDTDAPLPVRADAGRVREILENLLSNAVKYAAPAGPVTVEARRTGDRVVLRVLDRGPGLSSEQARYVFEEYWRADDGLTRETGGSGVGLFISREYARGMGGRLAVSPRAGGGCAFTLELPWDDLRKEA